MLCPASFTQCRVFVQRSEDKQQACALAQTMLQVQEMIQEVSKPDRLADSNHVAHAETGADGQGSRLLLSGSCVQLSRTEKMSEQEATVALEYIDHVKELRDQTADLEKECQESRQACNSAKVLLLATAFV